MPDDAKTPAPQSPKVGTRMTVPFQSLQDEMERLFHVFSRPELRWPAVTPASDTLGLRMDVSESDTAIQISAELPGVAEEDIEVSLEDDLLRISAVKSTESETEEKTWHVTERSYGKLERAIRVPPGIDSEAVKAVHQNGVLKIEIPKPADMASSTRKIMVTSE